MEALLIEFLRFAFKHAYTVAPIATVVIALACVWFWFRRRRSSEAIRHGGLPEVPKGCPLDLMELPDYVRPLHRGYIEATPEQWADIKTRGKKDAEGKYIYKKPLDEVWIIQRAAEDEGDKWEFLGVATTKEEAYRLAGDREDIAIGPVKAGELFKDNYKEWDGYHFTYSGQGWGLQEGRMYIDPVSDALRKTVNHLTPLKRGDS